MDFSKQEIELFLPLPGLWSKNFFIKRFWFGPMFLKSIFQTGNRPILTHHDPSRPILTYIDLSWPFTSDQLDKNLDPILKIDIFFTKSKFSEMLLKDFLLTINR